MPSVPKTLHMRSGSQPCVQLASSFRIGVRLSACTLAALLSPCVLAAQAQSETVGRIEGDAIAVKGAVGVEVENGRSITLLARDRKSTRLNSSHLVISYAVFCLKKKKKTTLNSDCTDEMCNI